MAVFKCKMCGGDLDVPQGANTGECQSCGTRQTLPKLDDEKRANLYDRANHFRRNNEYDKAAGIYETILNEDKTDAEAYWSLVLCKYGVEYVEDPTTGKLIPTCHRTQATSIYADEDYKQAINYALGHQKTLYEEEAAAIDKIQKGILEISNREEPFDVFICYKETDEQGQRTRDSVLAQELYYQLANEGFKVFFARITLENKLGSAYEPYIFAALQSSKVMVALGTKPAHFNAVWVKNEWSRYLALIKGGAKKTLIPAYRDMDVYDLPDEFSHLQALDMSKLGFMQDLVRGIQKLTSADKPKAAAISEPVVVSTATGGAEPLIKRAFLSLEDGDFNKASSLLESALNIDPENARAYLGLLLCERKLKSENALSDSGASLDTSANYQKAMRFADEALKKALAGYVEESRKNGLLRQAIEKAQGFESIAEAGRILEEIRGFKNADELLAEYVQQVADTANSALESDNIDILAQIKYFLESFGDFGGADGFVTPVEERIRILEEEKYARAQKLLSEKKYSEALTLFKELGDFSDAAEQARQVQNWEKYAKALGFLKEKKYDYALVLFRELGDFSDAAEQVEQLNKRDDRLAFRIVFGFVAGLIIIFLLALISAQC